MLKRGDIVEYTILPGLAIVVVENKLNGLGVGIDWLLPPQLPHKSSWKNEPHHTDSDFWVEARYLSKIGHIPENELDNFRAVCED